MFLYLRGRVVFIFDLVRGIVVEFGLEVYIFYVYCKVIVFNLDFWRVVGVRFMLVCMMIVSKLVLVFIEVELYENFV